MTSLYFLANYADTYDDVIMILTCDDIIYLLGVSSSLWGLPGIGRGTHGTIARLESSHPWLAPRKRPVVARLLQQGVCMVKLTYWSVSVIPTVGNITIELIESSYVA